MGNGGAEKREKDGGNVLVRLGRRYNILALRRIDDPAFTCQSYAVVVVLRSGWRIKVEHA